MTDTRADSEIDALVAAALAARSGAYAPYSGFATGAAVLTDSGTIHRGAMVENLVFGLAMCAERVALFVAITARTGRPQVLAVAAPRTAGRRTFPCGARVCRWRSRWAGSKCGSPRSTSRTAATRS